MFLCQVDADNINYRTYRLERFLDNPFVYSTTHLTVHQ